MSVGRRLGTALLFAEKNFIGPEYYRAPREANRRPDLLATGGRLPQYRGNSYPEWAL